LPFLAAKLKSKQGCHYYSFAIQTAYHQIHLKTDMKELNHNLNHDHPAFSSFVADFFLAWIGLCAASPA
jgi:hypothetical protein